MAEQLYKLSPDRDLQCYFLMPSAIAAMSNTSSDGFTLSGKWRQQFDWAVVEWNRDNVFEHPALRNLPDGDLSGLTLSYIEERTGCIPFESNLFPVVDWHNLRVWAPPVPGADVPDGTTEIVYHADFAGLITPIGNAVPASAKMAVVASPGKGEDIGVALLETHFYYQPLPSDDLSAIARGVADTVNNFSADFSALWDGGNGLTLTWKAGLPPPAPPAQFPQFHGANGNRITVYGFSKIGPGVWAEPAVLFSGGQFPARYQVNLNFGSLSGYYFDQHTVLQRVTIPTTQVRKLRWTWSADLQPNRFQQTEFQINISQWTVTGSNRQYFIAGPGSRRIEDTDLSIQYSGDWSQPSATAVQSGNYSNSKIHLTSTVGDSCTITYSETAAHQLYLGTRFVSDGATIGVSIDGLPAKTVPLAVPTEDVMVRIPLGALGAGTHMVTVQNLADARFFFDFLEIAYPSADLPEFDAQPALSLATDWDTYHSQSLPAERTAWLIYKLGFHGRVNHYVGALWFYEIVRTGMQYASLTLILNLAEVHDSKISILNIAPPPGGNPTHVQHLILPDDRSETVAAAYAGLLNAGTNLVWAMAHGNELTIVARAMGTAGNGIVVELDPASQGLVVTAPSTTLSGGIDGAPYDLASDEEGGLNDTLMAAAQFWRTDLTATPRLNRAARDWHSAYFRALKTYGLDAVAAFSTELMNVDPSPAAGMAQRYPDGSAVVLNTPAIQTNFSPAALQYWTQLYLDMAGLQQSAGLIPYLQSGEVQWWYFPKDGVGMTFYDAFTQQQFATQYGSAMQTILTNDPELDPLADEIAFLPTLIGNYTASIRGVLQSHFPACRYEVLYPTDVNATPFNQLINYPSNDWTPDKLTCLKTESFGFTGGRDLDSSTQSMSLSAAKGFLNTQRSHLVGIGDAWTAWTKEVDLAQSQGLESVVLFALDQYCLIGYPPAPFVKLVRSQRQG